MTKNYYLSGDHNITCDVCSKKIKMSEAKLRWDGFLVCKDDYEMRHPQDFVRARQDKISVNNTRPIPPNAFRLLNPIFEAFNVFLKLSNFLLQNSFSKGTNSISSS